MATAQDKLLIQSVIALMLADAAISTQVGSDVIQGMQPIDNVDPQITVELDLETKVDGLPAHTGTLTITGWYADSPATNITLLRELMAEVRELFDLEHETSSINTQVNGLKLRFMSHRNGPYLVDAQDDRFYCPAEYDVILNS